MLDFFNSCFGVFDSFKAGDFARVLGDFALVVFLVVGVDGTDLRVFLVPLGVSDSDVGFKGFSFYLSKKWAYIKFSRLSICPLSLSKQSLWYTFYLSRISIFYVIRAKLSIFYKLKKINKFSQFRSIFILLFNLLKITKFWIFYRVFFQLKFALTHNF